MILTQNTKIKLNDGNQIPVIGLGTYDSLGKEAEQSVLWALESGYRLIDTATMYNNEEEIGMALKKCKIKRSELFITSKVWETDHGLHKPLEAINKSLKHLQTDYLDLYLIHWPHAKTRMDTWHALEKIKESGKAKSIGVSNYTIRHLKELMDNSTTIPAINQVEFHPFVYDKELLDFCRTNNIQLQAYTPLVRNEMNTHPVLVNLVKKYNKPIPKIMLRWLLQLGIVPIPKSSNPNRIKDNIDLFDFEIDQDDMGELCAIKERYRAVPWNPNDTEWC